MERALQVLQRLDPPGIGARNLKECMAIQLRRKIEESQEEGNEQRTKQLNMALDIVENYFDVFKRNDREQLMRVMKVDTEKIGKAIAEIVKLNPRPGLSLSESATGKAMAIEPDFIIETSVDGNISFTLRGGKIPELRVNPEYQEILNKTDATKLTPAQKEDYKYIKNNVERAQGFINAIHRRQETLARTMKAIIDAQRSFMISQDDADLKPLTGGEIAKRVGVDGSTISRAVSGRYALLDGTLYPLKDFFLRTKRNANGEEVLRTQVETAIAQMIDNEDKKKPLNDIQISDKLKSMGLNIQRRTVAKYRDQMNIPTASLRKKYK
jgi:RNA polymerase sigma-54 factor